MCQMVRYGLVQFRLVVRVEFARGYLRYVQILLEVMRGARGDSSSILTPPPPRAQGPYPWANFERTLWCLGEICKIPDWYRREVYENFSDALSTIRLYGVDILLASASFFFRFFHIDKISTSRVFCFGEPAPRPNMPFFYCIVLFYLRYLPHLKKSQENVLQGNLQRLSRCSHWSRDLFWGLLRFWIAKGRVYWNHIY